MNYKRWVFRSFDKQLVSDIADETELDQIVVLIAVSRGITDPYEIDKFIDCEPDFSDPYEYSGMREAAERVKIALEEGEKILVFGDYDCDGVTATALLVKYLSSKSADVSYKIPNRESDGYGISLEAVEQAARDGVSLIITVDNGINAVKEVERASELGIDVIVTDHHIPQNILPDAAAVVDPHIDEGGWLFCDLCGAGVAFKLICAVDDRPPEEMIYEYGDLAALGTIADIVPLVSENRSIVSAGLKMINRGFNKGLRSLIAVSGAKYLNATGVSYTISPRINAAGRMSTAETAVKLLLAENTEDADYYAELVSRLNTERQSVEQDTFDEAVEIIEKEGLASDGIIVVSKYGWRIGVLGIVASRITEKYGKPSIVFSEDGELSVGSGRSIGGFSLFDALKSCSSLLVRFGGHELAAGVTINTDTISVFREKINEYAYFADIPFNELTIDCKIKNPHILSVETAKAIKCLEPFGAGNPVPVFAVSDCYLAGIQSLAGGKHIKLKLRKENVDFYCLMFGVSPENFTYRIGNTVDVAVTLDVNVYNGNESASVIVRAIRKSGLDTDKYENDIRLLSKLEAAAVTAEEIDSVYPSREETAAVYRYIRKTPGAKPEHLEYDLFPEISLPKIKISLKALCQLGLIKCENGVFGITDFSGKADIGEAPVLKALRTIKEGDAK